MESLILDAGEDKDCANTGLNLICETLVNAVEKEVTCHGSIELGKEV